MIGIRIFFLIVGFSLLSVGLNAQETIKIMHYNLLYYGKNTTNCTSVNNYIVDKNENLKKIIKYVQPDIFTVNELDGEDAHPENDDAGYLLANALNVDGVSYYRKTDFPKVYLANTVFYNSNKLILKDHTPISFYLDGYKKVFNVYTFYFNSADLETTQDTAFFSCLVAHLKAGNYPDQRAYEAQQIMEYYESLGKKGNYLLMGDFNVYTPTEECFQSFINPDNSMYAFFDPADQIGEWSGNYDYRYYHTQSTHSSGECHSGGGMDDRFDFILASDYIMKGTEHYKYIDNSYKIIGQDGSRYNNSLNITSNSVVTTEIAKALYNMSDHLPVYMEMQVDQNVGEPNNVGLVDYVLDIEYENPANGTVRLKYKSLGKGANLNLLSLNGIAVLSKSLENEIETDISLDGIPAGMYILNINSEKGYFSGKLIVNYDD